MNRMQSFPLIKKEIRKKEKEKGDKVEKLGDWIEWIWRWSKLLEEESKHTHLLPSATASLYS